MGSGLQSPTVRMWHAYAILVAVAVAPVALTLLVWAALR